MMRARLHVAAGITSITQKTTTWNTSNKRLANSIEICEVRVDEEAGGIRWAEIPTIIDTQTHMAMESRQSTKYCAGRRAAMRAATRTPDDHTTASRSNMGKRSPSFSDMDRRASKTDLLCVCVAVCLCLCCCFCLSERLSMSICDERTVPIEERHHSPTHWNMDRRASKTDRRASGASPTSRYPSSDAYGFSSRSPSSDTYGFSTR
jgi:hypothetical protein